MFHSFTVDYFSSLRCCYIGFFGFYNAHQPAKVAYIADDIAPSATIWSDDSSVSVPERISQCVMRLPITDKQLRSISIVDNHEPLVDLAKVWEKRIMPMYVFDYRYSASRSEGWSKVRKGVYDAMLQMLKLLPEHIGIVYSEGCRSVAHQKCIFDHKYSEISALVHNKKEAYQETCKHVAPFIDSVPARSTGAAIDMTLFILEGANYRLLDMGSYDTMFGPNYQQETFTQNTTFIQRQNRLMLLSAAVDAGFANYGFKWWHFSYGDRMHAYVYKKEVAVYGLVHGEESPLQSISEQEYISSYSPKW